MLHLAATLLILGTPPAIASEGPSPDYPDRVEVRRTAYGVPHIRADDLAAMGYGLAWVQLEDYGVRIPNTLLRARGHLGRYYGRDSLESDYGFRQSHARALVTWHLLEPDTRAVFEGWAAAVNRFITLHPGRFPDWMPRDFTGPDAAALWMEPPVPTEARALLRSRAARERAIADSLRGLGVGSNAWAFAPGRTTSGRAILLRNPHLDWSAGYYEVHVTVPGVLDFYGDFRVGYPLYLIGGFNARLGWATTNNDTDNEEVYALEADPAAPDHYRFDGASVPLERVQVTAEFKNGNALASETREFWRTPLGPVIERADGKIYVVRWPGEGEFRKGEQFLRMMQARTHTEWLDAMRLRAHTTSNLTYADADGNIFYIWNGTPPMLPGPSGRDTAAVPAAGAADVFTAAVPFDQLPQLRNPRSGYTQNSNDPFHFTNLETVLDSARFPANFPRPALRLRSQMGLALIHSQRKVSLEDVIRLKHSTRMMAAERFKDDLLAAARAASPDSLLGLAVPLLEQWDDTASPEARGAVLFGAWFRRYLDGEGDTRRLPMEERERLAWATPWSPAAPVTTPDGLADPARAVRALAWAVTETIRKHGRVDVSWGEVHRVRRGDVDVPVGGCHGRFGCFRVLWFEEEKDGRQVVTGGDGWVLAVEFGKVPRAYSVLAYGQSDQPDSPHHADQAALFARGELKPVAFTDEEIERTLIRRYRPGQ